MVPYSMGDLFIGYGFFVNGKLLTPFTEPE